MSWLYKKLSEICELNIGKTPSRSDKSYWINKSDEGEVWLSIADITKCKNLEIFDSKEKITSKGASLFKSVKAGTLMMSFKLSIGKLAIAGHDLYTNEAIVALPIKNKNEVNIKFLYYYLSFYDWDKESENDVKVKGKTLNKAKLNEILVPIPSLPTQQKIVAKLDAIFAEIDEAAMAAETNVKNSESLFKNYLTQVFESDNEGWHRKKISEISKIKGGKRVPKGYELKTEKTPFVYIRVSDFTEDGAINTSNLKYVDEIVRSQIKNYIIESKDLYVSIAGTIGRTGIVQDELNGSLLTENACRLVFNEGISNRFVYYYTKSSSFLLQTQEQTRTTAQPKLALSRLGEISFYIPNIDTQNLIVKQLDLMNSKIHKVKNDYLHKVSLLKQLRQSILKQAFNGELVKD